jgi:hypothetical protein
LSDSEVACGPAVVRRAIQCLTSFHKLIPWSKQSEMKKSSSVEGLLRVAIIVFFQLSVHRFCSCLKASAQCDESDGRCWQDEAEFQVFVRGEESLPPMTSGSKHVLVSSDIATWIRNTTVLLFSDHGGLVKDSAQELLHAGFPRENIFCVVSRYYAHVLQREYALDADLCTPPDWAGAALRFLNRDFPRRHAEYAPDRPTRMNWTVIEDPAFIRAFTDRFCPAIAAFDVVWVDIPIVFAALVAPCARGGAARTRGRRPRLVLRLGHRCVVLARRSITSTTCPFRRLRPADSSRRASCSRRARPVSQTHSQEARPLQLFTLSAPATLPEYTAHICDLTRAMRPLTLRLDQMPGSLKSLAALAVVAH